MYRSQQFLHFKLKIYFDSIFSLIYINSLDVLYFVFADQDYNECDKAEQEYNEEEHIYTNYTEGTVVWARMSGFPWQVL